MKLITVSWIITHFFPLPCAKLDLSKHRPTDSEESDAKFTRKAKQQQAQQRFTTSNNQNIISNMSQKWGLNRIVSLCFIHIKKKNIKEPWSAVCSFASWEKPQWSLMLWSPGFLPIYSEAFYPKLIGYSLIFLEYWQKFCKRWPRYLRPEVNKSVGTESYAMPLGYWVFRWLEEAGSLWKMSGHAWKWCVRWF